MSRPGLRVRPGLRSRFRHGPEYDIIDAMVEKEGIGRDLFWDTEPDRLDLQKNRDYIVERVLELGDDRAVRWLFSKYSRSEIKEVLARDPKISRKSFRYWSLVLNP
jgi:Family of unknown function (DUF6922)